MSAKPVYRVGLIGGGRQGMHHARAYHLHPRTEVVAAADTDAENAALFAQRFGVPTYAAYEDMLAAEKLDIAAPVLPVKANPDAVVAAAVAGVKGIFCEKPLAASLADADRMVEACASREIPLAAGLVVSSHPDYRRAYQLAAGGEIGRVVRINLYEGNHQMGTHGLNLVRKFAAKSPVVEVRGWVENDPWGDYEEDYGGGEAWYGSIGGYIRFANGIECCSTFTGPDYCGLEVVGTRGRIANGNNTAVGLKLWKLPDGVEPRNSSGPEEVPGLFLPPRYDHPGRDREGWRRPSDTMMASIDGLVGSMDTGQPLDITSGDDLRHALEMAIALRQSARQDGARVELPLGDRSLAMFPQRGRWHYKKDVHGATWYREQMAEHIQAPQGGRGTGHDG